MEADMSNSTKQRHSLTLRVRIAVVSLLSFIVSTACSLSRSQSTPTPVIMCYEMIEPSNTPTPRVTCYTAPPPTETPTPTTFTSPLFTPTPTSTPEARLLLLEELLTENRFPQDIVRELEA